MRRRQIQAMSHGIAQLGAGMIEATKESRIITWADVSAAAAAAAKACLPPMQLKKKGWPLGKKRGPRKPKD